MKRTEKEHFLLSGKICTFHIEAWTKWCNFVGDNLRLFLKESLVFRLEIQ